MKLKYVLFDLDGTLLPMDQDEFVGYYFKLLSEKLASHGFESKTLIKTVWSGTAAMIKNDGSATNEEVFWKNFCSVYGDDARSEKDYLEEFYKNEFQAVSAVCPCNPKAAETVKKINSLGLKTVLATNPIFPAIATESRIRFAGLSPNDFIFRTTYENSKYSKPNPEYYREILKAIGADARECLMVGNDVDDDMVAKELGMKVFLLKDCLINRDSADIAKYPSGSFDELMQYVEKLLV